MSKSFSAMILAAGFGKRMLPITKKIPKPLIEINNITLLENLINFLLNIGCKEIVINTHYKHKMIVNFIKQKYSLNKIKISYEKKILDTAGGVKNAIKLFSNKSILVVNSDIFLKKKNTFDIINLIENYSYKDECKLLLVEKKRSHGLKNSSGDFFIKDNYLKRWKKGNKIYYYAGIQMINLDILKNFASNKISFNEIWDFQIKKNNLTGCLMLSDWYHVGDENGLEEAVKSSP